MEVNWTQVIADVLIAIPATIGALAAWRNTKKTHDLVNGQMDDYKVMLTDHVDEIRKLHGTPLERSNDEKPG